MQSIVRPNGDRMINTNVLSAGTLHVQPDGSVLMSGTAEKAADNLGEYGAGVLNNAILHGGIDVMRDMGN